MDTGYSIRRKRQGRDLSRRVACLCSRFVCTLVISIRNAPEQRGKRKSQSAKLDEVKPFPCMQRGRGVGIRLRCASATLTLTDACRKYYQLREKLDPRAFTVFIATSNTERRRWYRLHKRVIEFSLYTKCHVLFLDDETGRTIGTFSSDELQNFTTQASNLAAYYRARVSHALPLSHSAHFRSD